MNILKIFGIVVAVHVAAFLFVFAIPGCRTTTSKSSNQKPRVETTERTIEFPGAPRRPAPTPTPEFGGLISAPAAEPISEPTAANGSTIVFPGARQNPSRPDSPAPAATPEVRTHTVAAKESLWSIAKKYNVSERDLAMVNRLNSGTPLRIGQVLTLPAAPGMGPGETVAAPTPTFKYTVRAGESLALIASRAGITTAELKAMNRLTSDLLRVGQELTLPAAMPAAKPETPKASKPGTMRHTVKAGESLGGIARRYGVPLRDIATVNNIANPGSLRVGTELIIPGAKNGTAAAPATTTGGNAQPPPAAEARPAQTAEVLPAPTPTPAIGIPLIGPARDTASPISPATEEPPINPVDDSGLITPANP